jgi:tRNA(Ile)-lysidine synthase
MASSRKPKSSDVVRHVAACLDERVARGARVTLGLSGGLDSVSLLSVLVDLAPKLGYFLSCVHVHHGLSKNADDWAHFCAVLCDSKQVPLETVRVDLGRWRGLGIEAAARTARYEAYAKQKADYVVLAHHRDDQAETLLLQLLRGAGVKGLAAMPVVLDRPGPAILRPLLEVPRSDLEAYARSKRLKWVDDESNRDTRLARNFLRHDVLPLLERRFPAARATIARSALHLSEAQGLLDALAREDAERAERNGGLDVAVLAGLGPARAKNLLRHYFAAQGVPMPDASLIEESLRQLISAGSDAALRVRLGPVRLRRYRGLMLLEPELPEPARDFEAAWTGAAVWKLPELGGALRFQSVRGTGISLAKLVPDRVRVRLRRGGERLRPDRSRPTRTLKNLLQECGVPPWQRERLPLLYCGSDLVFVPYLGVACEYQAAPDEQALLATWT